MSCDCSRAISRLAASSRFCSWSRSSLPRVMRHGSAETALYMREAVRTWTLDLLRLSAVGTIRVHVVDRGQRDIWRAGGLFDRLAASGQPVEHRNDAHDLVAFLAQALERVHRGSARGDHVLHYQAALARLERRA